MNQEIKDKLKELRKLRKEEIEELERTILKPLKDDLKLLNMCFKNGVSVKEYKNHAKAVNNYILRVFNLKG